MKKNTFLLLLFISISCSAFSQVTVLSDLSANNVNDSYPIYGLYQNAVSTTRGTATVVTDPAGTYGNCVKVVPTSVNHLVLFSVTIPSGKTLADFKTFSFDLNPSNLQSDGVTAGTGARYSTALVQIGSSCTPGASGSVSLLYETSTIDKGASNTWHTINVNLSSLTGLSAYSGTQNLFIGLYNNSNTIYYIDNIKIASNVTSVDDVDIVNPFIVYSNGKVFKMNQKVDNVELLDLNGRKIMIMKNVSEIPVSQISSGVYVVKALINGQQFIAKVLK